MAVSLEVVEIRRTDLVCSHVHAKTLCLDKESNLGVNTILYLRTMLYGIEAPNEPICSRTNSAFHRHKIVLSSTMIPLERTKYNLTL